MTYAKSISTPVWSHVDDAAFRVWGKAISDAMAAAGMVKTADTGQINWATVTKAGANSDAGYEIWRFDDSQQGSYPFYVKMRYGTTSNTSFPRLQVDFGTGTDGAGALTGNVQTLIADMAGSPTGAVGALNVVHADGYFGLYAKSMSTSGQAWRIAIERLRNTGGSPSARGAWITTARGNSVNYLYTAAGGAFTSLTYPPVGWPYPAASRSLAAAGRVFVAPCIPPNSASPFSRPYELTLSSVVVSDADFVAGDTFSMVRWDGVRHTYLVTSHKYAEPLNNLTGCYFAMLWE